MRVAERGQRDEDAPALLCRLTDRTREDVIDKLVCFALGAAASLDKLKRLLKETVIALCAISRNLRPEAGLHPVVYIVLKAHDFTPGGFYLFERPG